MMDAEERFEEMMDAEEKDKIEAIAEAMLSMPGMSKGLISVEDFLEALEAFGYMVLSQQEYDDATDPSLYAERE